MSTRVPASLTRGPETWSLMNSPLSPRSQVSEGPVAPLVPTDGCVTSQVLMLRRLTMAVMIWPGTSGTATPPPPGLTWPRPGKDWTVSLLSAVLPVPRRPLRPRSPRRPPRLPSPGRRSPRFCSSGRSPPWTSLGQPTRTQSLY